VLSFAAQADDAELERKIAKVKVFRQSDPPDYCEEIGEVQANNVSVFTDRDRERMMRALAAKNGANGVQVTTLKGPVITAVIFKCKK
jgi:hypothetical protein